MRISCSILSGTSVFAWWKCSFRPTLMTTVCVCVLSQKKVGKKLKEEEKIKESLIMDPQLCRRRTVKSRRDILTIFILTPEACLSFSLFLRLQKLSGSWADPTRDKSLHILYLYHPFDRQTKQFVNNSTFSHVVNIIDEWRSSEFNPAATQYIAITGIYFKEASYYWNWKARLIPPDLPTLRIVQQLQRV